MMRYIATSFISEITPQDEEEEKKKLLTDWCSKLGIEWSGIENVLSWKDTRASLFIFIIVTQFFWNFISCSLQLVALLVIVIALPFLLSGTCDYLKQNQLMDDLSTSGLIFNQDDVCKFFVKCWILCQRHLLHLHRLYERSDTWFYLLMCLHIIVTVLLILFLPLANVLYVTFLFLYLHATLINLKQLKSIFYPIVKHSKCTQTKQKEDEMDSSSLTENAANLIEFAALKSDIFEDNHSYDLHDEQMSNTYEEHNMINKDEEEKLISEFVDGLEFSPYNNGDNYSYLFSSEKTEDENKIDCDSSEVNKSPYACDVVDNDNDCFIDYVDKNEYDISNVNDIDANGVADAYNDAYNDGCSDVEICVGHNAAENVDDVAIDVENGENGVFNNTYKDDQIEVNGHGEYNAENVAEFDVDNFAENEVESIAGNGFHSFAENEVENVAASNVENFDESDVDRFAENEVENVTENKVVNVAENEVENVVKNDFDCFAENDVKNVAENDIENVAENDFNSFDEDDAENIAENNIDNFAENEVENVAENNFDSFDEDDTENVAENDIENVAENEVENFAENNFDSFDEDDTENVAENDIENVAENEVENIAGNGFDTFAENVTANDTKNVAENDFDIFHTTEKNVIASSYSFSFHPESEEDNDMEEFLGHSESDLLHHHNSSHVIDNTLNFSVETDFETKFNSQNIIIEEENSSSFVFPRSEFENDIVDEYCSDTKLMTKTVDEILINPQTNPQIAENVSESDHDEFLYNLLSLDSFPASSSKNAFDDNPLADTFTTEGSSVDKYLVKDFTVKDNSVLIDDELLKDIDEDKKMESLNKQEQFDNFELVEKSGSDTEFELLDQTEFNFVAQNEIMKQNFGNHPRTEVEDSDSNVLCL